MTWYNISHNLIPTLLYCECGIKKMHEWRGGLINNYFDYIILWNKKYIIEWSWVELVDGWERERVTESLTGGGSLAAAVCPPLSIDFLLPKTNQKGFNFINYIFLLLTHYISFYAYVDFFTFDSTHVHPHLRFFYNIYIKDHILKINIIPHFSFNTFVFINKLTIPAHLIFGQRKMHAN